MVAIAKIINHWVLSPSNNQYGVSFVADCNVHSALGCYTKSIKLGVYLVKNNFIQVNKGVE